MADLVIRRLSTTAPGFDLALENLLAFDEQDDSSVHERVIEIIARIRAERDTALLEYTRKYDHFQAGSAKDLEISREMLDRALESLSDHVRQSLMVAAQRIRAYAEHQKIQAWQFTETDGTILGQQVTALDRVGLYVPGGKAAYPSSVLMNAIPAKVAGVRELVMVVPTPRGELNDLVLACANLAGVDRVFRIGGAQAVAALAYGTETIPRVDKIVGPGNIYVATAKKLVFGQVGIDMIAGPSEILVISDGKTDPEWITADLFSQAEHDEHAQAILLCPDRSYLDTVEATIRRMLPEMERAEIIATSLKHRGALIQVSNLEEAADVANRIAPEHLELSVGEPQALLTRIRNAGAVFLGRYTAEVLGDYCAGPNHVLPTSGTARFSSPLGVYDFQKRTSIIQCSASGASELGKIASVLARGESLTAHARSAEFRIRA
ncbi:MAG: histidinol dehydrogenase [Methylococcales bacterium]